MTNKIIHQNHNPKLKTVNKKNLKINKKGYKKLSVPVI